MKAAALVLVLLGAQEGGGRWTKLADPPPDPAGREMSPGMMGAWVWVPDLKSFLLYGGRSPAFSNALWSFDPSARTWKELVACDRLQGGAVRRPGEIPWSAERPAPGSDFGAVYDPGSKSVWMAGGWRYSGVADWGGARFGTWRYAAGAFSPGPEPGPEGQVKLVLDPKGHRAIASPRAERGRVSTWVLSLETGRWEKRESAAGPRPSGHPALAFDERAGVAVLFDDWGQTWTYDPSKDAWRDMKPEKAPPHRRHAASWYDPQAGRVFIHGGITQDYPPGKYEPGREDYVSFYTNEWGKQYADVWSYDAGANEWREEKSEGPPAPSKRPIFRDLACWVPELKAAVFYDGTVGVWAYRR